MERDLALLPGAASGQLAQCKIGTLARVARAARAHQCGRHNDPAPPPACRDADPGPAHGARRAPQVAAPHGGQLPAAGASQGLSAAPGFQSNLYLHTLYLLCVPPGRGLRPGQRPGEPRSGGIPKEAASGRDASACQACRGHTHGAGHAPTSWGSPCVAHGLG